MNNQSFLNSLPDDWNDIKEIVVFGFGRTAIRNIEKLEQDFEIFMIIDNNVNIQGTKYRNHEISSFEKVKPFLKGKKIVITTSSVAYVEIAEQLTKEGFLEYLDFCRLKDFMAEWYWKNRKQVCLSQTFSSIISSCTFNCKHCNLFMPYFKADNQLFEYSPIDILDDFDNYFKLVDYLASWSILGGEPLLNKQLPEIIETVYQKYNERIGYIQIITNGSIIPDGKLLQTIKKCNVRVRLSDYTDKVSYTKKFQEVKTCLEENGIPYDMSIYDSWYDLGTNMKPLPEYDTAEKITSHMRLCATGCHQLNDKKFFFCGQGFARSKKGFCKLEDGDCIELEKCRGTIAEKEMLLRYCMGYPLKGYISVCSTCYGMGKDNERVVPVAVQV